MAVQEDLRYSEEGENTRAMFFQGFNDINIFIEDKNKEYEYEYIFRKLLGTNWRITAVFSANGKQGVKERYTQYGAVKDGVKNVYIVDGDFERYVCPSEMIQAPCFIYLKAYNIESHLIDQDAVIYFVQGKKRTFYEETKALVDFDTWKQKIVNQAKELFVLYCYVQYRRLGIENVGRSPHLFLDENGFERLGAYETYRTQIECCEIIDEEILKEIRQRYYRINGEDYYCLICGKFLFTSLFLYLRHKTQIGINKDDLRWALIKDFNTSCMEYVKESILALYRD